MENESAQYYPKEECGVAGAFDLPEAAKLTYLSIYSLQHRGQESAGIVSTDGKQLYRYAGMGKVTDVFGEEQLEQLAGNSAIAHNRYSTTGASFLRNAQPIRLASRLGSMALAHNGNLTNAMSLRVELESQGSIFQTTADTEVISHLMARSGKEDFTYALIDALQMVQGAYSLLILKKDCMYAVRDPNGFRPLVLGKKDGGYVVASETCALDIVDADYVRDIEPGELIKISKEGIESFFPFLKKKESLCIFEFIYFSRPDSRVFNKSVYDVRFKLGEKLAEEAPVEADIVMPVPDSSNVAALGFSNKSGIPFHYGLIRSHYIGRTFIEPNQKIRDFGAKLKYNAIADVVRGKRVVIVDDSIMRGTTQKKIIQMMKQAGAKELHVRISCSPTMHPCYYGIDIPTREELIAAKSTPDEIGKYLKVNSLAYLSQKGMQEAAGEERSYCMACFNGDYPCSPESDPYLLSRGQKELFDDVDVSP